MNPDKVLIKNIVKYTTETYFQNYKCFLLGCLWNCKDVIQSSLAVLTWKSKQESKQTCNLMR